MRTIIIDHDDFTLVQRSGSNPALSQWVYRYEQPDRIKAAVQIIVDIDPSDMRLAPDKAGAFLEYSVFQRGGIGSAVPNDPSQPDADIRWYSTGGAEGVSGRGGPVYGTAVQNRFSAIALGPGDEAASVGPTEISLHGFGRAYTGNAARSTFNMREDTFVGVFDDMDVIRFTTWKVRDAGRDEDGALRKFFIDRAHLVLSKEGNTFISGAEVILDFHPDREPDAARFKVTAHSRAEAADLIADQLMASDQFVGDWG